MSTTFILIYLIALISILLGIAGFIVLIYGLINKKKGMTMYGSIMTFIAILMMVTGIFFGARKVAHFVLNKHHMQKEMRMFKMHDGSGCMEMDSMMMCDSSMAGNDTNCMKMKCNHMKKMDCEMEKCDPGKCKSKCPHEKK